ncbi:MAG: ATP-binding cassette domain-containing protein [Oscillospiraceae bacterium]|jgi:energy-coupling factor transport system ATP-binding protein|nr:ATP-binding cassette domain-containing protein [Oscillospiraceae bacterium]
MAACIECRGLTFTYPGREAPALRGIGLAIEPGEFVVLCGPSGCGKTTLLRQLKPTLAPHGARSGEIFFEGKPLSTLDRRGAAANIGFVLQNPGSQIVTDKVWHELAFGLESLGFDTPAIRLRVAEMASFFGIQGWFHMDVNELSGGQMQLLALASVMALQPSLLILDEPTAQLDPIAAADFLAAVGKINRELGVTVLLTEHRLEEAFPLASLVIAMDEGEIIARGSASEVGQALRGHGMFAAMPVPMRVWASVENQFQCPVTVREGRAWLSRCTIRNSQCTMEEAADARHGDMPAIALENVWFKYDKNGPDVLRGLDYKAYPGELACILGGNGTGKTTALSVMAGLRRAYRGQVRTQGSIAMLPQNPQLLFAAKTVREDLLETLSQGGLPKREKEIRLREMSALCRLEGLLDCHPYDLSGGEQQRAALAKALLLRPGILLLDEPTKGLDAEYKAVFAAILRRLARAGATLVMVSHDIEFCAQYADRCALFFDGGIVAENPPRAFFSGNSFYTSAASRMARHVLPQAVTAGDIITALGGAPPGPPDLPGRPGDISPGNDAMEEPLPAAKKLTAPRVAVLCAAAAAFVATAVFAATRWEGFLAFLSGGEEAAMAAGNPAAAWPYVGIILAFAAQAIACVAALSWRRSGLAWRPPLQEQKLPRRTIAAAAMILLAIPLTIAAGVLLFEGRKYYFISLAVILETMLPFALLFERRRPQARELVVIAVLSAIAVAGRGAFFMLPQFKPVTALVIITGIAFGGEAGFLVGAVTGFASNMFFGQGPWTPWQMFAFGIVGFLAGVLFKRGALLRGRPALCVFGGLATLVIYGGLMNASAMLAYQSNPTLPMYLAYCLQGLPLDLVHALATVVFLAAMARPMLEKLDRIKVKYGLVAPPAPPR